MNLQMDRARPPRKQTTFLIISLNINMTGLFLYTFNIFFKNVFNIGNLFNNSSLVSS